MLKKGRRLLIKHHWAHPTTTNQRMDIRDVVEAWRKGLSPINDGQISMKAQVDLDGAVIHFIGMAGYEEIYAVKATKRRQDEE